MFFISQKLRCILNDLRLDENGADQRITIMRFIAISKHWKASQAWAPA